MQKLEDFRYQPGVKLRDNESGEPVMVLRLCAGLVPSGGNSSGGEHTVAVANIETGQTYFWHGSTEVRPY